MDKALLNLPDEGPLSSEESEEEVTVQFKDLGLDARLGEKRLSLFSDRRPLSPIIVNARTSSG
jgi:hypothetical protein